MVCILMQMDPDFMKKYLQTISCNFLAEFYSESLVKQMNIVFFSKTAVISCAIVIAALVFIRQLRSTFGYYSLVCGIAGFFSLPVLMFFFEQDFVSWLVAFICLDRLKVRF